MVIFIMAFVGVVHGLWGSSCFFSQRIAPDAIRSRSQRALRDRLMSRGKNCLPTVSRQFLTRNYPRPNCLLKCLLNCLSPTREGFLSSFRINPAVRVIARQVRDKNCLAAIFAPRHQSVSSGRQSISMHAPTNNAGTEVQPGQRPLTGGV